MLKKEGLVQLEDQTLENVSGGLRSFKETEYKNAGVIIAGDGYFAKGTTIKMNMKKPELLSGMMVFSCSFLTNQ